MDLMSLMVRIGVQGESQVTTSLRRVKTEAQGADGAVEGLGSALRGLKAPIFEMLGAVGALSGGVLALGAAFTKLSGISRAADLSPMRAQIRAMVGDARAGERVFASLRSTANRSLYDLKGVSGSAAVLLGSGTSAKNVVGETAALTRLFQASGVSSAGLENAFVNVSQLRSGAGDMADIKELIGNARALPAVLKNALGRNYSRDDLSRILQGENGGQKLYELLLRAGNASTTRRMADDMFAGDPAAQGQKLLGLVQDIMAPTGDALLKAFAPVGSALGSFASLLGKVNSSTGGMAGLAVLLGVLWRVGGLLTVSFRALVSSARDAAIALRMIAMSGGGGGSRLSVSAAALGSEAVGAAAGGTAARALTDAAGGAAVAGAARSGGWKMLDPNVPLNKVLLGNRLSFLDGMKLRWQSAVARFGESALGRLAQNEALQGVAAKAGRGGLFSPLTLIPIALDLGLGYAGSQVGSGNWTGGKRHPIWGEMISGLGRGIGTGAMAGGLTGAAIGSVVPVVGTALGALVGTIAGGVIGGGINSFNSARGMEKALREAREGKDAAEKQQKALDANTKALEGLRVTLIGGGPRASDASKIMEAEYRLARMAAF
jgi:hypothetical protein